MNQIKAVIDTNVLIKSLNRKNFEFSFMNSSLIKSLIG